MRQAKQMAGERRERLGPRPLAGQIAIANLTALTSLAALPLARSGSLGWNRSLRSAAAALAPHLAAADPERLAEAVAQAWLGRLQAMVRGIAAYRAHAYRRDLLLYARWLAAHGAPPLAEAGSADLQGYLAARHPGSKATSVNRRLAVFRRFHRWLVREGRRNDDPTLQLASARQPPRFPKSLSERQVEALLTAPDTDTALVKKIVKEIGKEISADPELGKGLIEPLKSQGIRSVEDGAIVIGVKYIAKPNEQFTIRREAYSRILDAFRKHGIELVGRAVVVKVEGDGKLSPQAAAAAASSSMPADDDS